MRRAPRMMDRMYPYGYPEPELSEEQKEELRIQQATRRAHAEERRKEARRQQAIARKKAAEKKAKEEAEKAERARLVEEKRKARRAQIEREMGIDTNQVNA